ncbi:hypothetical protein I553_1283 [Mycobacterium xenopi 4042]|uniref:Uncharacterized protein n=1 Tax=Mycobacterium xenopi 4042 TaxID=1299334 RepID=X8CEM3_MYCXE|nr:hypothetical protein I553_1283 [Mycobacterium xenopi 4042]
MGAAAGDADAGRTGARGRHAGRIAAGSATPSADRCPPEAG